MLPDWERWLGGEVSNVANVIQNASRGHLGTTPSLQETKTCHKPGTTTYEHRCPASKRQKVFAILCQGLSQSDKKQRSRITNTVWQETGSMVYSLSLARCDKRQTRSRRSDTSLSRCLLLQPVVVVDLGREKCFHLKVITDSEDGRYCRRGDIVAAL